MNAKVPVSEAYSSGGVMLAIFLNKWGLLLFVYLNGVVIAWLTSNRAEKEAIIESKASPP